MKVSLPRVIIAGTGSGVGKTSVTLALIAALKKRGLSVQSFKIGPDYLDPTYLSIASGRPCYNLDGWMTGEDYVCELFADRGATADVAVIEGVMGLFDGSDPVGPEGSTAEIAAWLNAPILLVVDAYGVARSFAAVVKGYTEFQPELNVVGVIANHCGSEKHGSWLGESLSAFGLPKLTGALPRGCFPELPSRHLGLITADSRNLPDRVISALADALERHVDVDAIWNIARTAPSLDIEAPKQKMDNGGKRARLGLAFDAAFHFYYPDNLEALERAGCELIHFSALHDESLPEALDAIYMGGGYPEEHAETLASNKRMLDSIRSFAVSGGPVYAECGGLMYLGQGIERTDGKRFELVGLVPAWTRMLSRLKSLGYVEVTLAEDSLFGKRGAHFRGHEFHYSELMEDPAGRDGWRSVYRITRRRVDAVAREGFQFGKALASYVHAHFASKPELVNYFVSLCEAEK